MRNKRVLGLDLGRSAFKLALVEWKEGIPHVTQMRFLELPVTSDETARQAALRQLLEGISLTGTMQTVSVVDDPFACVNRLMVPPMPAGELAGAVRWELQRSLAVPPEEAAVDYEILGEVESGGTRKLKLLAAALPGRTIQEHLAFLSAGGIKPTQLLPKASAIATWGPKADYLKEGSVALLVLWASSSEFIIVQEGRPLFTRKIPVSGIDFTKGMTGTLVTGQGQTALTESEAETIKRSVGIPQSGAPEIGMKGISGIQLLALLRGNLERLAAEVERSIVFYGESTSGTEIPEMILIGGGAHLKGLSEWLQERLRIRVSVPNPLKGFQQEPTALQGSASSVPLSFVPVLGAVVTAGRGINLLPVEMKQAAQTRIQRAALTGMLTATIVGALLLRIGMAVYERTLQVQIEASQLEQATIAPQVVLAKVALMAHEQQLLQPYWEEVFKELSQAVPREIYLMGLTVQEGQVTLRGRVRELGRPTDQILADFQRTLGEGLFTQLRLNSTRQLEDPLKEAEFEIVCLLK